jgi:hypothetical protein
MALIAPVRLREVASGLMMENVRSMAMAAPNYASWTTHPGLLTGRSSRYAAEGRAPNKSLQQCLRGASSANNSPDQLPAGFLLAF